MKLNSLKSKLREWEQITQQKHEPKGNVEVSPSPPVVGKADPPFFDGQVRPRRSEKVVGGDVLWKPIDRAAAMMLAKAPWWAQPIYEAQKPETKTPEKPDPIRAEKGESHRKKKGHHRKVERKPMEHAITQSRNPVTLEFPELITLQNQDSE